MDFVKVTTEKEDKEPVINNVGDYFIESLDRISKYASDKSTLETAIGALSNDEKYVNLPEDSNVDVCALDDNFSVMYRQGPITVQVFVPYNDKGYSFDKLLIADKRIKQGSIPLDDIVGKIKSIKKMKPYFNDKFGHVEPGDNNVGGFVYPVMFFTETEEFEEADETKVEFYRLKWDVSTLEIQKFSKFMGRVPFDEPKEINSEITKANFVSVVNDIVDILNKKG